MMIKWQNRRLESVISVNPVVRLSKGEVYPYIDIDKISPAVRSVTSVEAKAYTGQGCSKFQNGDTLFSRITPCLENRKIAMAKMSAKAGFGSTEFYVFRAKKGLTDERFVYYLVSSDAVVLPAINSMTGASGRQRADKHFIERLQISIPDLPTQERIADILSAYDDLIENNNRRIALLEKAARELYKEWFVRFRFPGYETAAFENGLPVGWDEVRLNEIIEFNPSLKNPKTHIYKSVPMSALSTSSMIIDCSQIETTDHLAGSRFQNGDTLLARITPCLENGKTGFVQCLDSNEVAGGSTEFIVMRSKKLNPYLVYFIARNETFRNYAIASMNGADGRQRVKPDCLEKLHWLLPKSDIIDAFEERVRESFKCIQLLSDKNRNLAKQRDLLLPRLMSGKLRI